MELTERLELSTSPLPRECSTTELRQLLQNLQNNLPKLFLLLQSYREPSRPSMTRKAKNPNRTHVSDRYFPGSIVCQAETANTPRTASAITILPLPAGVRSITVPSSAHHAEKK